MVVVEIEALSGYQFDEEEVQKLIGSGKIRNVELHHSNTRLIMYFDEVGQEVQFNKMANIRSDPSFPLVSLSMKFKEIVLCFCKYY